MLEAVKAVGLAFLLIYLFGTIPMAIRVAIDRIDGEPYHYHLPVLHTLLWPCTLYLMFTDQLPVEVDDEPEEDQGSSDDEMTLQGVLWGMTYRGFSYQVIADEAGMSKNRLLQIAFFPSGYGATINGFNGTQHVHLSDPVTEEEVDCIIEAINNLTAGIKQGNESQQLEEKEEDV